MATVISLCDLTGNFVRPWVDAVFAANSNVNTEARAS